MIKDEILEDIKNGLTKAFGKERNDRNIHVSQMDSFCVRRFCLSLQENKPYNKKIYFPVGMYLTRGIGLKYEDLIVESLKILGYEVKQKFRLSITLADDFILTGEIDLIHKNTIIDVKSMKPEDFESENIPKAYFNQVQYYLWLAKLHKLNVNTKNGFLCLCKKNALQYSHKTYRS